MVEPTYVKEVVRDLWLGSWEQLEAAELGHLLLPQLDGLKAPVLDQVLLGGEVKLLLHLLQAEVALDLKVATCTRLRAQLERERKLEAATYCCSHTIEVN